MDRTTPPFARLRPLLLVVLGAPAALLAQATERPGYTDTERLPDGYRVHDRDRPYPPVVTPSPAGAPQAPPADAVVLFDGRDVSAFVGGDGEPAQWTVQDGCVTVNGTGDVRTKALFGDCQLHVEWRTPAEPHGDSQHRNNSGVFLMDRYEVQILDSYDNPTYADGQAAALYGQYPPLVNCCRKPGEWQTYDIAFVAPRFAADGSLVSPARVTVWHNGIVVQLDRPLLGVTAHRALPRYRAHAERAPIRLQDHGNPVSFRNLWVREADFSATAAPPAAPTAADAAASGGDDRK
ncbi:MAG: DUF1080 domain-containing protein [Planctomycetota bacterium]